MFGFCHTKGQSLKKNSFNKHHTMRDYPLKTSSIFQCFDPCPPPSNVFYCKGSKIWPIFDPLPTTNSRRLKWMVPYEKIIEKIHTTYFLSRHYKKKIGKVLTNFIDNSEEYGCPLPCTSRTYQPVLNTFHHLYEYSDENDGHLR